MNNIFCIFPNLKNYSGHEFSFTPSLNALAKKIKYSIIYLTPKNNIKGLNNTKIYLPDYKAKFIHKLIYIYLVIKNLNLFFKKRPISSDDIMLIDGYTFLQLTVLSIFFYFSSRKLNKILIYYRIDISKNVIKKILFNLCSLLLKSTCDKYYVLTDNKKLNNIFKKTYAFKSKVLPIPHILRINTNQTKKNKKKFSLWIPGPFRPDKGITNTISIINMISNDEKFSIKVNPGFKKFFLKKIQNIEFTHTNLNQHRYSTMLAHSDAILIPYDHKSYRYRTSGIFLESISAKKITLVSADTWMADELAKNKLGQLIIKDWSNDNFLKLIEKVYYDRKINHYLKNMQKKYLKIHGPKPFINDLEKIIL